MTEILLNDYVLITFGAMCFAGWAHTMIHFISESRTYDPFKELVKKSKERL